MTFDNSAWQQPSLADLSQLDSNLAEKGVPALKRPHEAAKLWGEKFGSPFFGLPHEQGFREAFEKLHPSVPFGSDAFLTLCVSARSISYFLKPPIVLGRIRIEPLQFVSITEMERNRIRQDHPAAFWEMVWQASDGIDLFMAQMNYQPQHSDAQNMMATAVNQLTASARQLVACEVDLSLPQGIVLACELAGKSILRYTGVSEKELRDVGHDLVLLSEKIAENIKSPVDEEVLAVAKSMPKYVQVRYDAPKMNIADAQDIFRRGMFLIADFIRRTNHDCIYWKMINDKNILAREW